MKRYVLMVPPPGSAGGKATPLIIRDAFSVFALVLPVVWLLWNRMWIAALASFALLAAGAALAWHFSAPFFALALDVAVSAIVALEGGAMRIAALEAAGWRQAAIAGAASAEEAELRLQAAASGHGGAGDAGALMGSLTAAPKSAFAPDAAAFAFPSRG
jgi:hypothetical protein